MKKEWNDVREFHEKFGHPVAPQPRMVERGRALSRGKWMNEEVAEFLVAQDIYEQADAMIDLIYFALGTLVEMGLEADELFDIVQKANMAKLWPDGKPHYNPKDGKVIKPDGWEDPAPKIKAYNDAVIAGRCPAFLLRGKVCRGVGFSGLIQWIPLRQAKPRQNPNKFGSALGLHTLRKTSFRLDRRRLGKMQTSLLLHSACTTLRGRAPLR